MNKLKTWLFSGSILLFASCDFEAGGSNEIETEEILETGRWKLIESDKVFKNFQSGLKFSKDNQVFSIDSQGGYVASPHERIYTLSADTLRIIDYRYEPNFLYEKGTNILLIKELTEDKLILESIHPEPNAKLSFEKID
ncbi:hypothetical protein [Brumimicrobium aurantiacum]|nr:hypothetical protein [Brumimicrobium aurantiacum]